MNKSSCRISHLTATKHLILIYKTYLINLTYESLKSNQYLLLSLNLCKHLLCNFYFYYKPNRYALNEST